MKKSIYKKFQEPKKSAHDNFYEEKINKLEVLLTK